MRALADIIRTALADILVSLDVPVITDGAGRFMGMW